METDLRVPEIQSLSDLPVDEVSLAARQLRHGLLNRDPVNRLGSKTGANEIKQHSFFREMNWPLIRCMLEVPLQVTGREPDSKVKDAQ
ncbi:hypothetical protein ZIOFF_068152 [Zingiber officinale]|uniref:non-specific serine/threonine protein kinase n=1 Tax=Zingiber officinale TaxID=94328 RepID=A0A8J5EUX7_ZINOF|nr:hypothetical protein ZIOFF_068152 [Zingiber officinale]